jgi:glutamine synthetase
MMPSETSDSMASDDGAQVGSAEDRVRTEVAAAVLRRIEGESLAFVRCEFIDYLGVARGRDVYRDYLPAVLQKGLNFGSHNNIVDIDDLETDPAVGSQSGDLWAVPDPHSFVKLPYTTATGHMFTDLVGPDGAPWPNCARTGLKRLCEVAQRELGHVQLGFEQEGYILRRNGERYEPLHRAKQFTAEIIDAETSFLSDLSSTLVAMEIPLEKMTAEGGWGMFEVNFRHDDPLAASERYFHFKQAFRSIARAHGYVGSFMPKPFAAATGAGLHVHISCEDSEGHDIFGTPVDQSGLSSVGRAFLGGLMAHAASITAIGSASVNSYKRLQPGSWSPTHAVWGSGNRSAMVRIVEERSDFPHSSQRLELRSPDGTCNPYLLATGILAAGLDGVRRQLDPGPEIDFDVARPPTGAALAGLRLPNSLDRALDALDSDETLREVMGAALVDSYLKVKRLEWAKFAAHVTDWEYRYYTEFF